MYSLLRVLFIVIIVALCYKVNDLVPVKNVAVCSQYYHKYFTLHILKISLRLTLSKIYKTVEFICLFV